jgi:hypothetical protein
MMPTETAKTETTAKAFRLSEFVKDGYLAQAIREEFQDLGGRQLELAQDAVVEVATSGITGDFEYLVGEYRRAIRRRLHPDRKLVKNPKIDRTIVKSAQLAALLDRELRDVTQDELDRANKAVKRLIDKASRIAVPAKKDGTEERKVDHEPDEVCRRVGEHSTLGECGYFRDPAAWPEVFRAVVRQAIAGE